jgi:hypothetical protein
MKTISKVMFVLSFMLSAGSAFAADPATPAGTTPAAGTTQVGPNTGDCAANNTAGAKGGGTAVGADGKPLPSTTGGTAQ